jgi:biopolymer transport protein ExbD
MSRALRWGSRRHDDGTFELQLTSMIDIFTIMVFFLLKGFAAVALGLVFLDAQIPQPVQAALEKDRNKKERDVVLRVDIQPNRALAIEVTVEGNTNHKVVISPKGKDFDLTRFHTEIVGLKIKHPDVFRIDVNPSEQISYKEIISVMDQVRTRLNSDPKVFIQDEATKKQVETNLLFPDVVFGNVMEG